MRAHFWPDVPIMTDHEPFAKTFFQKKWMYPPWSPFCVFRESAELPRYPPPEQTCFSTGSSVTSNRVHLHPPPGPSSPSVRSNLNPVPAQLVRVPQPTGTPRGVNGSTDGVESGKSFSPPQAQRFSTNWSTSAWQMLRTSSRVVIPLRTFCTPSSSRVFIPPARALRRIS
jgi:hypothetical protein